MSKQDPSDPTSTSADKRRLAEVEVVAAPPKLTTSRVSPVLSLDTSSATKERR